MPVLRSLPTFGRLINSKGSPLLELIHPPIDAASQYMSFISSALKSIEASLFNHLLKFGYFFVIIDIPESLASEKTLLASSYFAIACK